uniref:Inorganic pyrophosphatase 2 n=1 Tax=Vitis vinifera TaxID=29760 RepID=A5AY37_VITVI|nr:hypothetical protein VITISV_021601 [Vitis vinifera]
MAVVVVFDFDKTIIDCDSDNWVVDELGLTPLFTQLLPTMPWNSLMDRMFMELHSQGKTMEEIAECLKRAPLHPRIISAIKSAHASGCDLRIVSDANAFFIETVLKHHGLMDCFSEIKTNPSFVDGEGRLRILPYHDLKSSSHGCNICPPNMCKGLVMERVRTSVSAEGKKRFIYLGDGSADFCSGLKLGEGGLPDAQKELPHLGDYLHNGEELEKILLHLITTISIEEKCNMRSEKCQASSMDSHKTFQSVLPVPH